MKPLLTYLFLFTCYSSTYSQIIDLTTILEYDSSFTDFETEIYNQIEIDTVFTDFQFLEGGITYNVFMPEFKDVYFVAVSDKRIVIAIVYPTFQEYLSRYNEVLQSSCLKIRNSEKWDWHCTYRNKLVKMDEANDKIGYIIVSIDE